MMSKSKVPQIRFEGFSGEWEEKIINDLGDIVTGSTPNTQDKSNYGGKYLFVSPADIQNNRYVQTTITTLSIKGHNLGRILYENSILFVSIGSTIGKVAQIKNKATTNQQINAINPNKYNNSNFIYSMLVNKSQEIKKLASAQAVPIINKTSFSEIEVIVPSDLNEQTKIGNYLQQLDKLIEEKEKKHQKLKQFKKAMLDKMFPKNGANTPEVRFEGFSGEWEEKKLGEISESFEYGLNVSAMKYDGKNKYIRITDINEDSHKFNIEDLTSPNIDLKLAENYKLNLGDILFARTGASVGKTYIYEKEDGLVYFAGFLIRAKIKQTINPEFIFQNTLTKKYDKFIRLTSQRSGQPGVNAQEYSNYKIYIPCTEEQTKIGNYFQTLDKQIDLQNKEIEKLKNIKKASLDKMFV